MTELITAIVPYISPAAFPTVVVVLGLFYIYRKIGNERKATKSERDTQHDDLDKRLTLVEHDVNFMKQQNTLFADKLDRILDELTNIKVELAKKEDK